MCGFCDSFAIRLRQRARVEGNSRSRFASAARAAARASTYSRTNTSSFIPAPPFQASANSHARDLSCSAARANRLFSTSGASNCLTRSRRALFSRNSSELARYSAPTTANWLSSPATCVARSSFASSIARTISLASASQDIPADVDMKQSITHASASLEICGLFTLRSKDLASSVPDARNDSTSAREMAGGRRSCSLFRRLPPPRIRPNPPNDCLVALSRHPSARHTRDTTVTSCNVGPRCGRSPQSCSSWSVTRDDPIITVVDTAEIRPTADVHTSSTMRPAKLVRRRRASSIVSTVSNGDIFEASTSTSSSPGSRTTNGTSTVCTFSSGTSRATRTFG
mmetsp:Transcript_4047/g.11612  ORF Transcript_4047/g.11612 Transcript_4047/m.11612 type:complete len:340 (-) Transcript_4047:278-1297(-)